MAVRTRLVNHEVTELLHRLGIHNERLSDPERAYLHRYIFLSIMRGFTTLGIRIEEQDPILPAEVIPVPFLDRVPQMPPTIEAQDILDDPDITEVVVTNGRHNH